MIKLLTAGMKGKAETVVTVVPRLDVTESEIFVRHCFSRVARLSSFYGNCVIARVDKHILERAVRRVADVETVGRRAPGCHDVDVLEVGVRTVADTH